MESEITMIVVENSPFKPNNMTTEESDRIYSKIDDLNKKITDTYTSILTVIEKHCLPKLELVDFKQATEERLT